jgi:hypothetical protein
MNWYITKIVFRIICGDGNHTAQFDEQLRLVAASSLSEAMEKAIKMGKQEEDSFLNLKNELVQWKFINISEVYLLSNYIDGAELFSRIEEKEDGEGYTAWIHKKATGLVQSGTYQLLQLA